MLNFLRWLPSLLWGDAVDYFKRNKFKVIVSALLIVAILFILFQQKQVREAKREKQVAEHNLAAATDTIRVTKAKNGQIEFDKLSFIFQEISDLKKANADLYKEVKNTKGNVNTIIKSDLQIVHDTVPLVVKGHLIDSTVVADFSFDTTYSPGNFRKRAGYTKYDLRTGKSSGVLSNDQTGIVLVTGIKNLDKGKPEIFVRSTYPGLEITKVDGAVLDKSLFRKKQPLITIGASIGYTPLTYDIKDKKFEFKPTRIGGSIGLNFNLFRK
jgi:hypothetical protein